MDIFSNQLIQFDSNNVTDLHHLTIHSTTCWPTKWRSHCDHKYVTSLHPMYSLHTSCTFSEDWGHRSLEQQSLLDQPCDWHTLMHGLLRLVQGRALSGVPTRPGSSSLYQNATMASVPQPLLYYSTWTYRSSYGCPVKCRLDVDSNYRWELNLAIFKGCVYTSGARRKIPLTPRQEILCQTYL